MAIPAHRCSECGQLEPFYLSIDLTMRVRSAVKKLCDACRIVKRRGRVFVVCKANPKVFTALKLSLQNSMSVTKH